MRCRWGPRGDGPRLQGQCEGGRNWGKIRLNNFFQMGGCGGGRNFFKKIIG